MSTRARVLERLAPGTEVSGQQLAEELGVSRVAVTKHVSALRAAGYVIEAKAGRGYRMIAMPDLATPAAVSPLLTDPLWVRVEGGEVTGSTNDDARALARAGAPEGTLVVAARQTAGRGRLGRQWESPAGGAYLSAVLRPHVPPSEVSSLALAVALAVARAARQLGVPAQVKWPNDVVMPAGKLAGVLLEMAAESDRVDWVVAGIGLNAKRPDGAQPRAVYLSDEAGGITAAHAAAEVLGELARVYRAWSEGGFRALREEYEALHSLGAEEVAVRDATGAVKAAGRVSGVDDLGRLVIESQDGGTVTVSAGEVTLRAD